MTNQQAIIYINQQLTNGVPKKTIATNLLLRGWEKKDIDEAFFVIESVVKSESISTPTNTAPPPPSSSTQSPPPIINIVQPIPKGTNFWKILGIILLCIILIPILFIAWGFYLIRT